MAPPLTGAHASIEGFVAQIAAVRQLLMLVLATADNLSVMSASFTRSTWPTLQRRADYVFRFRFLCFLSSRS